MSDGSCEPVSSELVATESSDTLTQPKVGFVLAGNPNVGKSVVFHALTGMYVNVSNFPGTTVDLPKGTLLNNPQLALMDSPGVYGLSGLSEEEQVAEKAIMGADVVINVVAAPTLSRDLFLTQQLLDYGKRVVVVLNQMDELTARGDQIDVQQLSQTLGVPVLPCCAVTRDGIRALQTVLTAANTTITQGHPMPDAPPAELLRPLEREPAQRMTLYGLRRGYVNAIVSQVFTPAAQTTGMATWQTRARQLLTLSLMHPVGGIISLLLVMLLLYQTVGVWVAGDLVNFTENTVMGQWIIPPIQQAVSWLFPKASFMYTLLAGEFGLVTLSIQYIYGVLFPLVLGFYVYISLLEDCGYLPRLAVVADGLFNRLGLNGRAIIPLILGFGCVTMATVSTRVLTSQRERTIASVLLAITVPCSAQLAVIMGLMATKGGLGAWAIYVGILLGVMAGLGMALNRILPGRSTPLILDLPPLRWPNPKNVLKKTWIRTWSFVVEAAPLFVLGSLLVSVLQTTGLLLWTKKALAPLVVQALNLPQEAATAFVMGMVRRDFGAAGLFLLKDQMSTSQVLTALMVITLFVPCMASAAVFWKERGAREASIILLSSWGLAFVVGTIMAQVFWLVGWH